MSNIYEKKLETLALKLTKKKMICFMLKKFEMKIEINELQENTLKKKVITEKTKKRIMH